MKKISLIITTLILSLGITFFVPKTSHAESVNLNVDYNQLYQEAISAGALNPQNITYDQWVKENDNEFVPVYKDGLNQNVFTTELSYNEWLKLNNYGQPPTIKSNKNVSLITPNATVGGFTIKAGDILITNATISAGFLGHAAIANGDNHILDMPGYFKENRQSLTADWINEYSKPGYWIQVYRLNDSVLAQKIASYADTHYYSTTGSATRNVFLTYEFNPRLYEINPTYCSKLVFDALWYGSGSAPVMQGVSGFVLPYDLIYKFTSAYIPLLVKTYNN